MQSYVADIGVDAPDRVMENKFYRGFILTILTEP